MKLSSHYCLGITLLVGSLLLLDNLCVALSDHNKQEHSSLLKGNNIESTPQSVDKQVDYKEALQSAYVNLQSAIERNSPSTDDIHTTLQHIYKKVNEATEGLQATVAQNTPSKEHVQETLQSVYGKVSDMSEVLKSAAQHNMPSNADIKATLQRVSDNLPDVSEVMDTLKATAQSVSYRVPEAVQYAADRLPSVDDVKSAFGSQSSSLKSTADGIATYISELGLEEMTVVRVLNDGVDWAAEQVAQHLNMDEENAKKIIKITVISVAGTAVVYFVIPQILPALGFNQGGVLAGSVGASIQSVVYKGNASGFFSLLQSSGALGINAGTNIVISSVSGVVLWFAQAVPMLQ